jgi:hypothetical protein
MSEELVNGEVARNSVPIYHDTARHSLTISESAELFAPLGTSRSKRSVQRFCEQEHLDCVRIKGARGDQFFINCESVERCAEELRQIEAVSSITSEPRHDGPQRAVAHNSAPERDSSRPTAAGEPERVRQAADESEAIKRLESDTSICASTTAARKLQSIFCRCS